MRRHAGRFGATLLLALAADETTWKEKSVQQALPTCLYQALSRVDNESKVQFKRDCCPN